MAEWEDRFGPLPVEAAELISVLALAVTAGLTVTEIEHVLLPLGPSAIVTDPVPAALPDAVIETDADRIPLVYVTVTNNNGTALLKGGYRYFPPPVAATATT